MRPKTLADELALIACWASDEAWLQPEMCPAPKAAQRYWGRNLTNFQRDRLLAYARSYRHAA
jgi:hypothetical protein